MSRHLVSGILVVAAFIVPACSSVSEHTPRARGGDERPSGRTVLIPPRASGWKIDELFSCIHETTGISIQYDSDNGTFKQSRVEFSGVQVIAEDRLFDWLQAVVRTRKLVLVPISERQWFLMDQADPNLKARPVYIHEDEIDAYAARDDVYVVTTLNLQFTTDTTRMRNALAPFSTSTAGIGRIQDIPGSRSLIVGDYGPVVAEMKRRITGLDFDFALGDIVDSVVAAMPSLAGPPPTSGPTPQSE